MHVFEKNSNIFNLLSEAVSEGILVVNQDQVIVATNSMTDHMFGYDEGELKGKSLHILIPESYKKAHANHVTSYLKKGSKRKMAQGRTLYGIKKTNNRFPLEVGINPFTLYGNKYVMALVRDVTERQEIEKNHKIKTAALKSALNGITITDAQLPDNPIIYFNPAFEKLTGYSADEIYNKNCRFLQGEDGDQEGLATIRDSIKNDKSCQVEIRNYKKDGTLFWNEVSINPITNGDGKITHFVGIQNDVTERKIASQEIEHLAKIFDESLNEICVFEAESLQFVNANHGAQMNTGYSLDEFKQRTPLDLKPEFSETAFRKLISPIVDGKEEKIKFETLHQRKNGTTYPVEVHMQGSTKGNKKVIVAIILDISERKDYTEKLEKKVEERTLQLQQALTKERELNELKTKFLSLVSHEFKTPLSGIMTSATLVGKYAETHQQDKRDKHLKTITSEVKHLNNILSDFLSIERLEKGKEVYKFSSFSLSKIVNEVIYNANMLLKSGQQINYPQNIDDVFIHQDEKIVSLILSNLINNAVKYSPEDTTIDLQVELLKDTVVFHVIDQGMGIPEKDQKHIFERYFRAENALLNHGTGIGLNIIRGHLDNLNGHIHFQSVENKGSTFTVSLPITKPK